MRLEVDEVEPRRICGHEARLHGPCAGRWRRRLLPDGLCGAFQPLGIESEWMLRGYAKSYVVREQARIQDGGL